MARTSFTFKQFGVSQAGSFLQATPVLGSDDDSALKGDNYVSSPDSGLTEAESFFDVTVRDYGKTLIKWGIGTALQTTVGATPVATEVMVRYDTIGEPQTASDGKLVTTITADRVSSSIEHSDLPDGTWVYYTLFVKYQSTVTRSWYERVASVHILTPERFGSTDILWKRIPRYYRIQDGIDSGDIPVSSDLYGFGPLYRLLDVFGWDIDKLRTLIHHQMVTRDPMLASTEALDMLAQELGVYMSSTDLGTTRLRNILNDIGYLYGAKGTLDGVREWLTAISGSDVIIRPTVSNTLTATQSTFSGTRTDTTNDSLTPTGNQWVFYSTNVTSASASGGGVTLTKSSSSSYEWAVAKVRVTDINQGSWYRAYFDVTNQTNASVVGMAFSPSMVSSSGASVTPSTGDFYFTDPTGKYVFFQSDGNNWYQAPLEFGISGDGTFTTTPMYLHIFMVFGPATSSLTLNNIKVLSDDRYPYEIDIYSQRVNLSKDPQFYYGNAYWPYTSTVVPAFITGEAVLALDPKYADSSKSYIPNTGTGGASLNAYYGPSTGACISGGALYCTSSGSNYATVQDHDSLDLSGDVEFVARVSSDGWTTQGGTGDQPIISKPYATGGYIFSLNNSSIFIAVARSGGGGTLTYYSFTWTNPTPNGSTIWLKGTRTTAGSATFYIAADQSTEPTSWTTIGSVTGASGTIITNTSDLTIGQNFNGRVYRSIARNGIGASAQTVLDVGFSNQQDRTTTFLESTGKRVTLVSSADTSRPKYLEHSGTNYLYVPGGAGGANVVSIANQTSEAITGDIEMVVRFAADNWRYASNQPLIAKRAANPNYSWQWHLNASNGVPVLVVSPDGTLASANANASSAASVPTFVNGTTYWHKVTRNATTGVISYYYANDSASEPAAWTQIATGASTPAGAIWAGNASIDIAGNQAGGQSAGGKWYRAIVRSGIGASATAVVDLDFTTAITTGDELGLKFTGTAASTGYLDNAMFISNLGTAGNDLDMRLGNVASGQSNTNPDWFEPKYLPHTGTNYLYLPGYTTGNNYVTAPSATIPTTSLSVRAAIHPNTWRPTVPNTGASTQYVIASQYSSTANGRSWLLWISETGALQYLLSPSSTGGSSFTYHTATVPISASAGLLGIRADWSAPTGAVTFYTRNIVTAASSGTEVKGNSGWTQLGASVGFGVTQLSTSASPIAIGSHSGGQNLFAGKYYASYVEVDGSPVLDINFPSKITDGSNTSFIEDSPRASTVTIQRASVGSKPVCVTRPLWLFGADASVSDYLTTVRTSPYLDIGASESMTVFASMRQWGTPTTNTYLFSNRDVTTTNVGWNITQDTTTRLRFELDDGPTGQTAFAPVHVWGSLVNHFGILNRANNSLQAFTGASTGASTTVATVGSVQNTVPLVIGRYPFSNGGYVDMEFYGAAIWKRALSSTEQTTIRNYFDGTETPEALALLAEAIFWIDPKRSVQRAAIVRNTLTLSMKPACVTRPVIIFDGNDYLQVVNNSILDITASTSRTVMAIIRQQAPISSFGRYISKRDFTVGTKGWELTSGGGVFTQYSVIDDSTSASVVFSGAVSNRGFGAIVEGRINSIGFILNRSNSTLKHFNGASVSSSYTSSPAVVTVGDTSNTLPITIGGANNSVGSFAGFQPFELLGLYVWNRVLSQAELVEAYRHAVSPGSVIAYNTTANLGASSSSSASVTFATAASVPIRLGIPYYLSLTDIYNNIDNVALKSRKYGTLATASTPFNATSYSDGSKRKIWKLQRDYAAPWLPQDISDCYFEVQGSVVSSGRIVFTDPLFEAFNSSGEYFDGDNTNGGWLVGPSASSGVADYRWGDAGKHLSFSYFTSDYQRTVSALYRLLDTVIPVTQTDTPQNILNLDRVYGYSGLDRP